MSLYLKSHDIWSAPHIILLVTSNAGGASTRGEIAAAACLDEKEQPLVRAKFVDMSTLIEWHIEKETNIGKEFTKHRACQDKGGLQPDTPILQAIKETNESLAPNVDYVIWRGPGRNEAQAIELGNHYPRSNIVYYQRTEEYSIRATEVRRERAEDAFKRDPENNKPPRKDDTREGVIKRYRDIYAKHTLPALQILVGRYHWPIVTSYTEPDITEDVLMIIRLIISDPLLSDEIKSQILSNLNNPNHPAGQKIAAIKKADEESPIIESARKEWETEQPEFVHNQRFSLA